METRHWKRCTWQTITAGSMAWSWHYPGSSSRQFFRGHARERHQGRSTAEEQETDRVVLRDLRRTADVLRESGSAKNFEDITEQDWPDGDLNSTAEDVEPNQETSQSQLPSRRLVRKTPAFQESTRNIQIHRLSMSDKHQLKPRHSQQWNRKQHPFFQR